MQVLSCSVPLRKTAGKACQAAHGSRSCFASESAPLDFSYCKIYFLSFLLFKSCKYSLCSLKPWSCNPISLALRMEGSLRESIKKASLLLLLCNLSNPVGLIAHREQKSIHLITKRCDKNTITRVYGGKLLAS